MKLIVVGSSSSGNGYIFKSDLGELLLLEAGVNPKTVRKAIDYRVGNVSGIIVSHCHGDHAKYIAEYSKMGIPVGAGEDMHNKFTIGAPKYRLEEGKTYSFGTFRVTPFTVKHDVPNFGYLIYHRECGTVLFATDTFTLPYAFRKVRHFLIEANYADDILKANVESGEISRSRADRLMVSHMSLRNCIGNLKSCDAASAETITLIHLSSQNSDAGRFRHEVMQEFGIPTYIADKGLEIELT